MKDMFIKKILKEGEEAIPEEAPQFEDMEANGGQLQRRVGDESIEMTRQSRGGDPLLNPLLELDDQRIQG